MDTDKDGMEILSCGHKVRPIFPLSEAPSGTYRRVCNQCGPPWEQELFFPPKGGPSYEQSLKAKEICKTCPVRQQCLDYAVDNRIRHGVWGGMTHRERRNIVEY